MKTNLALRTLILFSLVLTLDSCLKDNNSPASGTPNDFIAIADVRKILKGEETTLTKENMAGATKITGVVISDVTAKNFPKGTIAVQQTSRNLTRGIEIYLGNTDISYKLGDSLVVMVEGALLAKRSGALQVVAKPESVQKISENKTINPTQVSITTFNEKFQDYESTFVKIAHVSAQNSSALTGDISLTDITGNKTILHTEATATFAAELVPINASYAGVARFVNTTSGTQETSKQIWPLNAGSITDKSGAIYSNYPEDFENPDNALATAGGYSTKTGFFKMGTYTLTNVAIGKDANDNPSSGTIALRYNQNLAANCWTTMNFDLPNGASKLTIWAGSYGASADLGSTWRVEYSQNQGLTWSQIGNDILTVSKTKDQFTFLMDLKGNVRFRFGKIGIGVSSVNNQNGRFSMDDLVIYQNPGAGGPINNPIPTFQTLAGWQFGTPATVGNEAVASPSFNNSNLTVSNLSRGAGLAASGLARTYSSVATGSVVPTTKALALANNTYYEVSLMANNGQSLSLSAVNLRLRRSAAGAKSHKWYYSLDGVNFKETSGTGDVNYEGAETEGVDIPIYYLYQTPDLQLIPAGKAVTLRMYCWGFTNLNSGSFSVGRTPLNTSNYALTIEGKVAP